MGYPESQTEKKVVTADDGTPVTLVVPTNLPSNERAEVLRALYQQYVKPATLQRSRGPVQALVPPAKADDVAEAMAFMGDVVDERVVMDDDAGTVYLFSNGYHAHGF